MLWLLPFALLVGCSDDVAAPQDGGQQDLVVADQQSSDQGPGTDGTPDATAGPDLAPSPDLGPDTGGGPPLLGKAHTGYKKKNCGSCHVLPIGVTGHPTTIKPPECASCHGGNGACKPNGTNSARKDHKASDNCLACHSGGKHGFKDKTDCKGCHIIPTAGRVDC